MTFLVFSFDGSGKDGETAIQSEEYGGKVSDNNITNIVKLHMLLGGNILEKTSEYGKSTQANVDKAFFYPGVGAYGNKFQKALNMLIAPEDQDIREILRKASGDLLANLPKNMNDLVVLITGYSRGAALARRFATVVHKLLDSRGKLPDNPFIYLAVFDTVASIGLPDINTENSPKSTVLFEDCTLCSSVSQANHMVSIDEKRRAFQPTLMNHDPDRILEVWFAGAHGDVGGGYLKDGLSDITLNHTVKWLEHLVTTHNFPVIDFSLPSEAAINLVVPEKLQEYINQDDLTVKPRPTGKNHQQGGTFLDWAMLYDRVCCVIKDDKIDESYIPIIHHSVPVRIYRDQRYNPVTLMRMRTEHEVWRGFGKPRDKYRGIQIHQEELNSHNWIRLEPGESIEVLVEADRKFNFSGIQGKENEEYEIISPGDQQWNDAEIPCDADGWTRNDIDKGLLEFFIKGKEKDRRMSKVDWFCLCGAIGTSKVSFEAIGKYGKRKMKKAGELTFFANDLDTKYHNNWGTIEIVVKRLS
jgi:hypothetical protein